MEGVQVVGGCDGECRWWEDVTQGVQVVGGWDRGCTGGGRM